MTVPAAQIQKIHEQHRGQKPTVLTVQPWSDMTFEVKISGYRFIIAAEKETAYGQA